MKMISSLNLLSNHRVYYVTFGYRKNNLFRRIYAWRRTSQELCTLSLIASDCQSLSFMASDFIPQQLWIKKPQHLNPEPALCINKTGLQQ